MTEAPRRPRRPARAPRDFAATSPPGAEASRRRFTRLRRMPVDHRQWGRTVTLMKLLLPAAAIAIISLVIFWSQIRGTDSGFRIGFSQIRPEEAKTLRMVNARYAGTTKSNRPYLVTADEAVQDNPSADVVRLTNPKGDMTTRSGAWVALSAPKGTYSQKKELLDLYGGVELFHDSGLHFTSPAARINLAANTAMGDQPVEGSGPSIAIKGQGFRVLDGGNRIVFTGEAQATLYPLDKRAKAAPARGRAK